MARYSLDSIRFGYGDKDVLRDIDLTFEPGQFHAIVGPNGSGKSTLLDAMAGHHTPQSGSIRIDDQAISTLSASQLARRIAMVPQQFDFNFPFTVFEAVLMGRHPHIPRFSRPTQADLDIVQNALETTGLTALASRSIAELSGGEKQRTVFARALAQNTPCLLLDEPTSSMDIRHALSAMSESRKRARQGHTVIAVLHDLTLAATFSDQISILDQGQVFMSGRPDEVLTPETIHAVFGVPVVVERHEKSLFINYVSEE